MTNIKNVKSFLCNFIRYRSKSTVGRLAIIYSISEQSCWEAFYSQDIGGKWLFLLFRLHTASRTSKTSNPFFVILSATIQNGLYSPSILLKSLCCVQKILSAVMTKVHCLTLVLALNEGPRQATTQLAHLSHVLYTVKTRKQDTGYVSCHN